MSKRLLKCSQCSQILGTYPKYCPFCGGLPMTTDGEERIVPVPEGAAQRFVYKPPDPNEGRPRVSRVERSYKSAVNTTPNYNNEARPSSTTTSRRYREQQRAWYDPPKSNNASGTTVKKAKPSSPAAAAPVQEPVKLNFKASTPEERLINRLSAVCTAVVMIISGVIGVKLALGSYELRTRLGMSTVLDDEEDDEDTKARKSKDVDEHISEQAEPSIRETLDIEEKVFIEETKEKCDLGSFKFDSYSWILNDEKQSDDGSKYDYTLFPSGYVSEMSVLIRFEDTGDRSFTPDMMLDELGVIMLDKDYELGAVVKGSVPYDYYRAVFRKKDEYVQITCMSRKGISVTIFCSANPDMASQFSDDLMAIAASIKIK